MTLIIGALHKHTAFMATDTQLTNYHTGEVASDSAVKSLKLECSDGYLLLAFTGDAYINGDLVSDWIVDQAIDIGVGDKAFQDVIEKITQRLGSWCNQYLGFGRIPGLLLVATGWEFGKSTRPAMYIVTNCEDEKGNHIQPLTDFQLYPVASQPNYTAIAVRGATVATNSAEFKRQKKHLTKLLAVSSNKLDMGVSDSLAKLVKIAASDPRGTSIGEKVMVSRLTRHSGVIKYRQYPSDTTEYIMPHSVNKFMAIKDVKVHGVLPGDPDDHNFFVG